MSAPDSAVGVPLALPAPKPAAPLKVYAPPPVYRQGQLPLSMPPLPAPRPDVLAFRLDGESVRVRYWTPDAWERTPRAQRPGDARRGDGGGWYAVEVTPHPPSEASCGSTS